MKVIYAGSCNSMSARLIDRLVKEDEQAYIIADRDFAAEVKPALKYKLYCYSEENTGLGKIFSSIAPDVVIFAGEDYSDENWEYNSRTNAYLSGLLNLMNLSADQKVKKFIYLSSAFVYPDQTECCNETEMKQPSSYKGQLCSLGEDMVMEFHRSRNMDVVILRMGSIYGFDLSEEEQDFLSVMAREFVIKGEVTADCNKYLNPTHIKDCVDAILRVRDTSPSLIYNVSGSQSLNEVQIAELLGAQLKLTDKIKRTAGPGIRRTIDCSRIKKELEWVSFHKFDTVFNNHGINLKKQEKKIPGKKLFNQKSRLYKIMENLILFFVFSGLTLLLQKLSIHNTVNLMLVYIVLVAILYGTNQAVLSIILATAFYILMHNGLADWKNPGILSSTEFILTIVQYIFIGLVVGYVLEYNRTVIREKEDENIFLAKELEEIKEINDDNIRIKREYEKRILTNKTSLPKLYSIISRLTVLEPERIFTEAVSVIRDIMDTDTVAVYLPSDRNNYLRLIASSSAQAVLEGKSVNLDNFPQMKDKIIKNEIFIGSQWNEKEPSLAAPIFNEGKCIAVIVINKMKFSNLNLYQINLFRTLTVLITSSVVKAKEYEAAARAKQYVEDTEILKKNEFEKLIAIKKNGKAQGIADFSTLRLSGAGTPKDIYYKAVNYTRNTDFFGTDDKDELFLLLSNTSSAEVPFVQNRLKRAGLETVAVSL